MANDEESAASKAGTWVFIIPLIVCSMEMIPGWGLMNLGWSRQVFYLIVAITGAVGGLLMGGRYWLPGLIGGSSASVGALYAIAFLLERVNWIHSIILMIVGFLGCLPGMALYAVLRKLQDAVAPTLPDVQDFGPQQSQGEGGTCPQCGAPLCNPTAKQCPACGARLND